MDFNLVTNLKVCAESINEAMNGHINLLYYSHIPSAVISLIMASFVFFKNRKSLAAKLLLMLCISFSIWVFMNLIAWVSYNSQWIMLSWSLLGIFWVLTYIFSVYFVYVYIDKKDISFSKKVFLALLILPIILLTPTIYNLSSFDSGTCYAVDNSFLNYIYVPQIVTSLWIIVLSILRYRSTTDPYFKKQIILLFSGISLFLLAFFTTGYLADYFEIYKIEIFGLFSMPIFVGFLAYLIVKFKAFEIKLLAAQALIAALIILIGSQFFFIESNTNKILTGITLTLAVGFGYMLIRSIMMEVKRKEELQMMTEKLAQANDQLRKLDNAKSEFISIASHQLRTPLTAIKGFISLLLEGSYGKVAPTIEEVLNKVYVSNERLIALVEDMLNLSRIESGRMEYKFNKTDIGKMAKEVYDTFVIRAKDNKLKFELKVPEGLPLAMTDQTKLQEVVSNLVDNAIKYTPKGLVKVALSGTDNSVRIAVTDTGIGVPKEEIPYLFQKFSRGKDISRLNTGGTGLGLHVGKKMMEALHGKIWMESEGTGRGSTFYLEVPTEIEDL